MVTIAGNSINVISYLTALIVAFSAFLGLSFELAIPPAASAATAAPAANVAPVAASSRLLAPTKLSQSRARPRSASPAVASARGRASSFGGGGATATGPGEFWARDSRCGDERFLRARKMGVYRNSPWLLSLDDRNRWSQCDSCPSSDDGHPFVS